MSRAGLSSAPTPLMAEGTWRHLTLRRAGRPQVVQEDLSPRCRRPENVTDFGRRSAVRAPRSGRPLGGAAVAHRRRLRPATARTSRWSIPALIRPSPHAPGTTTARSAWTVPAPYARPGRPQGTACYRPGQRRRRDRYGIVTPPGFMNSNRLSGGRHPLPVAATGPGEMTGAAVGKDPASSGLID